MRVIYVTVPWLPSVYRGRTTWAITVSPFVFILPKYRNDPSVLAHEMVQISQVRTMGWWKFY